MTNTDHIWHILDDVLLLLAGQHYPTPERTYKLDGGWSLALADLKRCFADLRSKLAAVEAERDAAQKRVHECETRMMRYAIQLGEMQAERDAARAEVEENNYPYPDFSCGTFAAQRGIELKPAGGPTYTTTIKHWRGLIEERDAARAEAEKLRDKAELLDEIITNRISLSYRDGIPVTAHIWSARTDNGFGTGNTLPEALAALRAAKAGGK